MQKQKEPDEHLAGSTDDLRLKSLGRGRCSKKRKTNKGEGYFTLAQTDFEQGSNDGSKNIRSFLPFDYGQMACAERCAESYSCSKLRRTHATNQG